jgi:hypothetical protein
VYIQVNKLQRLTVERGTLALGGADHAADAVNHLTLGFQVLGLLADAHD